VEANVGGKIAQVGSRLIDMTAKKMADIFFGKFSELVTPEEKRSEITSSSASDNTSKKKYIYILGAVSIIAVLLVYFFK